VTGSAAPPGPLADDSDPFSEPIASTSRWLDIGGPVHYLDFGGPRRGPLIVCVHGLAGSAVNWSAIAPLLTGRCRVLAPDLAGHGLTRSARRGTDVQSNTRLLKSFIDLVSDGQVILMGNSMGGMISLLAAQAAPDRVSGLVLVDPALPFVPARPDLLVATAFLAGGLPGVGSALLRGVHMLPPAVVVARILSLCCQHPSRVPAAVVAQHIEMERQRAGFAEAGHDLGVATRSVIANAGLGGHAYRAVIASLTSPVLVIHGERDRLVPVSAARSAARAHPSWSLVVLPDVGHVPQLEASRDCADAIFRWLDTGGQPAAEQGAAAVMPALARRSIRRWRQRRRES
jgi:pimeloyl-ACP methyl ester carboxylesterase